MTTLPLPATKFFAKDTLEKQIYSLIDSLADYLPITNDRNRLSFSLYKYLKGEGDEAKVSVKSCKLTIKGISEDELIIKIEEGLKEIKN